MTVPDFQSCMRPVLQVAQDGQVRTNGEFREAVAAILDVRDEDREEWLPSGRQRTYDNRVGWAITYLYKAGLLERVGRGQYQITERGKDVHDNGPARVSVSFLKQFESFSEFHSSRDRASAQTQPADGVEPCEDDVPVATPLEAIDDAYQSWREQQISALLDRAKAGTPRFFEQLVLDVLVAMGYGGSRRDAAQAMGRSGDGGIDGIIKEDRLGLDVIYVQAKRWEGTVGRPTVQAFAGSLMGQSAQKGILLTTSGFSQTALDYVSHLEKKIILIDGAQLAELMLDYSVGVTQTSVYAVKDIDEDYFDEGG